MKLSIAISVRTFQVSFISFLLHKDYVCSILIWKKKSIRHNLSILGKLTDLDSFNRQKKCSNFLDTNRDVLFRLCCVCQKEKHCDNGMSSFEHFFFIRMFFFSSNNFVGAFIIEVFIISWWVRIWRETLLKKKWQKQQKPLMPSDVNDIEKKKQRRI